MDCVDSDGVDEALRLSQLEAEQQHAQVLERLRNRSIRSKQSSLHAKIAKGLKQQVCGVEVIKDIEPLPHEEEQKIKTQGQALLQSLQSNLQSTIHSQLVSNLDHSYHAQKTEDIREKVRAYMQEQNLDRILAGLDPQVKVHLKEEDPEELDVKRAKALASFYDFE